MAVTDDLDCENLNSTECVLKYLKIIAEAQKSQEDEFNWDPVSVSITAAIGVLALSLALLAVGQAVFSAAHGRVKASRYAIGPWHKLSVSHLSWSEMRLGAVTYTPLISISDFIRFYDEDKRSSPEKSDSTTLRSYSCWKRCLRFCVMWYFKPLKYSTDWAWYYVEWMRYFARYVMWLRRVTVEGMTRVDEPDPPRRDRVQQGRKGLREYFPAQWLCLLSFLAVDHPQYWPLRPVGLDYIPTDLAAAPARGPVRDLCILALLAAAMAHTPVAVAFDKNPNLPRIYTDWFDFHFERHPHLGYLAVFHVLKHTFLVKAVSAHGSWFHTRQDNRDWLKAAYGAMKLAIEPNRFIDFIDETALKNKMVHVPWAVRRQEAITRELWNICNDCRQLSGATHNLARVPGCSIITSQLITNIWSPTQPFEILFSTPKTDSIILFPYIRFRIWSQMRTLLLLKPKLLVDSPPSQILLLEPALPRLYSVVGDKLEWPDWYHAVRSCLNDLDGLFAKYPEDASQTDYIPPRDELKRDFLRKLNSERILSCIESIDGWLRNHEPTTPRCRKATLSILAAAGSNLIRSKISEQNDEKVGCEHAIDGDNSRGKFTIGSLQKDIIHCRGIINSLAEEHGLGSSPSARREYRSALLTRLQNAESLGVSQLSSEKHDVFIDAFLELVREWNEGSDTDYYYIEHPIDDMIITRGILTGIYYLKVASDTSWVLDRDETWNQVVSFL